MPDDPCYTDPDVADQFQSLEIVVFCWAIEDARRKWFETFEILLELRDEENQ